MLRSVFMWGLLSAALYMNVVAAETREGESITITSAMGTTLQGYVAGPEDAGRAILLLHDRWGFNETMRQWADQWAAKGYRVLAIDVFDGRASNNMKLATEIMDSVDPEGIKQDVLAGLKYLAAPRRAIATVGAGLGGWQSFQAALLAPEQVAATVVIYGEMSTVAKEVSRVRAPVLAVFAASDREISTGMVNQYQLALKKSDAINRFVTVAANHGFMDPHYPGYSPVQAQETWEQVERFLSANIGDI